MLYMYLSQSYTKAWFHITVITQINKPVLYFIIWRNVKFGFVIANLCTRAREIVGFAGSGPIFES